MTIIKKNGLGGDKNYDSVLGVELARLIKMKEALLNKKRESEMC